MRSFLAVCLWVLVLFSAGPLGAVENDPGSASILRVVDAKGKAVVGAVVWAGSGYDPIDENHQPVVVSQIDKQFVPQLTVVQTGTRVEFPNHDSVGHHVYSFAKPNAFEFPLYSRGESPSMQFNHAGVITLGCNIHDSMLGYIVVVDSPLFATTDDAGNAVFPAPLPADITISVWSPRLNPQKQIVATYLQGTDVPTVQVGRRLRAEPHPAGGSLSWDDY